MVAVEAAGAEAPHSREVAVAEDVDEEEGQVEAEGTAAEVAVVVELSVKVA